MLDRRLGVGRKLSHLRLGLLVGGINALLTTSLSPLSPFSLFLNAASRRFCFTEVDLSDMERICVLSERRVLMYLSIIVVFLVEDD